MTSKDTVTDYAEQAAKAMGGFLDREVEAIFKQSPLPKPPPESRWTKIRKAPRRTYQYLGEKLTRYLMDKFGVYDDY